jgi:hypothetical protein
VRTGTLIAALSLGVLAAMDVHALLDGLQPESTLLRAPAILGLRFGFLVIAVGTLVAARPASPHWRLAVRAAVAMLLCCVMGELWGVLAERSIVADLGAIDDVARRLFRLAQMAALAVPLLALLAAREAASMPVTTTARASRAAQLLLQLEPLLFAIGATTLATILLASAFVYKEIAWALPIGADTTVLACIAAAWRASYRRDRTALWGWAAVAGSMIVGLLMGVYAFGGPLPTPALIGDYASLVRTILRDLHIIVLALGIIAIALRTARS